MVLRAGLRKYTEIWYDVEYGAIYKKGTRHEEEEGSDDVRRSERSGTEMLGVRGSPYITPPLKTRRLDA
jgi:hypothetical protein